MSEALALFAAASLTFIPLAKFARLVVTESPPTLDLPPMPSGSLERRR